MVNDGMIHTHSTGLYTLLPYTMRALEKLTKIIDDSMKSIGAHKFIMPTLASQKLWQESG